MKKNSSRKIKIGDLIKYNYLYSNEEPKIGVVIKLKKDLNFDKIIHVVTENQTLDMIPYSIMEFKIINDDSK